MVEWAVCTPARPPFLCTHPLADCLAGCFPRTHPPTHWLAVPGLFRHMVSCEMCEQAFNTCTK